MTDRIVLTGMRFFGYHGVFTEETRLGQQFLVDLELFLDLRPAGQTDDLTLTVDYGRVYLSVKEILEGPPVQLLETVAERVAERILEQFPVSQVIARIHKPGAPIPGPFDGVMVEARRRRTAYLSLGSNLGDRVAHLTQALRLLESPHAEVARISSVYETRPQGKTDQPNFLNIAVGVATDLEPTALLRHLLRVEQQLGRVRTERWGPRTIDIDLLLYGPAMVDTPELALPHPRMKERGFVLIPLLEVAPNLRLPTEGEPLRKTLDALPDQGVSQFLSAESFTMRVRGVQ